MRSLLLSLLALSLYVATAKVTSSQIGEIGIYGGGPLYSGGNPSIQSNINSLRASGFTTVIGWSVHVYSNGDFVYNGATIISNGSYVGDSAWPGYLQQLKTAPTSVTKIVLSFGSAGVGDFQSIHDLIKSQGTGPSSILYKNLAGLKKNLPMVDGIDLDDEDFLDQNTIAQFAIMAGTVGLKVSFCPYYDQSMWIAALKQVNSQKPGTVTHFNLQCYAGGAGNDPTDWQKQISQAGMNVPVYPGVMCQQSGGSDTSDIEEEFQQWGSEGIKGGYIWLYDDLVNAGTNGASYASAIKKGLQGN